MMLDDDDQLKGIAATLDAVIEAWRASDPVTAGSFFAPYARYEEFHRTPIVGRDAIVDHFTRFLLHGPAWRFELDDLIVEEPVGCLVYRFSIEGADGKWHERAGCAVARFNVDGEIAAWREYEG
jgi:hypothetical protein